MGKKDTLRKKRHKCVFSLRVPLYTFQKGAKVECSHKGGTVTKQAHLFKTHRFCLSIIFGLACPWSIVLPKGEARLAAVREMIWIVETYRTKEPKTSCKKRHPQRVVASRRRLNPLVNVCTVVFVRQV
jgi:hypothetical protein